MTTTILPALKIVLPRWEGLDLIYANNALITSTAGSCIADDKRASQYTNPNLWYLTSATNLLQYNTINNEWLQLASPALTPALVAGGGMVFAPSHGPRGTLATGATSSKITLTTALPATVSANQLTGQRIRIIGKAAGSSGKTEERTIVGNTAGTTPIIDLDTPLTFAPLLTDGYEFLTGRLYMLSGGLLAAGSFRYYDLCTSSFATVAQANLPATVSTDASFVALDELYTPLVGAGGVAVNGEVGGFFGTLTATASAGTTLTGQAVGLDAEVLANEYRNFQVRIVEDTAAPTAVGQRRRITSHTAGASPVYTVPTWTVTPSATAKYVIENNNDIILRSTAVTTIYRYEWVGNAWDTTTYAVSPAVEALGCMSFQAFSGVQDPNKNFRYSFIYSFRGGAVNTLDILDIAGATTGAWTTAAVYDNQGLTTFGSSAGCTYDPVSNLAVINGTQLLNIQCPMFLFDVAKMSLRPYKRIPQIASTIMTGSRTGIDVYVDGNTKKSIIYHIPSTQNYMLRSLLFV